MSFTIQQAIAGFEGLHQYNEIRMKSIKEQLKARQTISQEDETFLDHYATNLIAEVRLIEKLKLSNSIEKTEMELSLNEKQCLSKLLYEGKAFSNSCMNHIKDENKRTRRPDDTNDNANKKRRVSSMATTSTESHTQPYPNQQQNNAYPPPNGMNASNSQMHNLSDLRTPLNYDLSMTNQMIGTSQPQDYNTTTTTEYQPRPDSDRNSASTTSTPSTTPNTTNSKKREVATLAQKIEILTWYQLNGENQTQTARHFDQIYPELKLSQPLISSWLKNTSALHTQFYSNNSAASTSRRRQQKTKHVQVTEALEKWCQQAVSANMDLNGDVIREKWREFARHFRVPESNWLKLSEGWLSSFKERNGLKGFKRHGHTARAAAAASASNSGRAMRPAPGTVVNAVTPPARPMLNGHPSTSQLGTPLVGSILNNSHQGSPMMNNPGPNRMSAMLGPPSSRPPSMMEPQHVINTLVHMGHIQ